MNDPSLPVSTGLQAWYKADEGTYQDAAKTTPATADGDPVGCWADQGNWSKDVTQAVAGSKPTLKLNVRNNKPAIRFSSDYLQGALVGTLSQPVHVFVVARLDTGPDDGLTRYLYDGDDGGHRHQLQKASSLTPDGWRMYAGGTLDDGAADLDWHIFTSLFNGVASELRIDGVQVAAGNIGTFELDGLTIGANYVGGSGWAGDIAELLVYDPSLTNTDMLLTEAYLKARWDPSASWTTLLDLIREVAALSGPFHVGVVESGSTTTIVDTSLIEPDDFWNNHYVYISEADGLAPQGEERHVSDWVQSTGTLTLAPALTAAVAAGDAYLLTTLRRADIVRAINAAIGRSAQRWGVPAIDTTTITISEDVYQYNLPTDLVQLADVLYRADTDRAWRPIERGIWSVAGSVGTQVLDLLDISGFGVGDSLRLDYTRRIPTLSADLSALEVGGPAEPELIAFLLDYSAWYLHQMRAAHDVGAGTFREHYTMARTARENAEKLLEQAPTWRRAGKVHTPRRPNVRG